MRRSWLLLSILWIPAAAQAQPIELHVDAREAPRMLLHAQMRIPASSGPLTLVYPKWLPGEHAPNGPVTDLVGVRFSAGGKPVAWRRDPIDMYAFHLEVPQGAGSVEASLDVLSPRALHGFTSSDSTSPHLALLTWSQLVLYPQGAKADEVTVQPSLRLPAGWKYGTSLVTVRESPERIELAPVSLTTLVDSPVLTGEHFLVVPLDKSDRDVELHIAADSAAALAVPPELTEALRNLVIQADALFGARHFDRYRFLLTLSDHVAHYGLEHHQSNDIRMPERALLDGTLGRVSTWLLPHEYVHSWNGKHRRPTGMATSNYQEPMQGELLWVYEGLTQYLGYLLAARSGLWTPEQYRERLARVAADLDHRPGRAWRPLVDTTVAAQLLYDADSEWASYRRGIDFYNEGWLIWLDVDTLIREQTGGRRSLDDFIRLFLGGKSGPPTVRTYTVEDVLAALGQVHPHDWRTFLMSRVGSTGDRAPLGGIERAGFRLVYDDTPNADMADLAGTSGTTDAAYSIGIRVRRDGTLQDVLPGTPAYEAGLGPGMKLVAVNSRRFSPGILRDALKTKAALTLLVENQEMFTQHPIRYDGGWKEPHLERNDSKATLLDQILAPLP